jgi:hypothetical protein
LYIQTYCIITYYIPFHAIARHSLHYFALLCSTLHYITLHDVCMHVVSRHKIHAWLYDIHILQFWHHHLEDMGKEVQRNCHILLYQDRKALSGESRGRAWTCQDMLRHASLTKVSHIENQRQKLLRTLVSALSHVSSRTSTTSSFETLPCGGSWWNPSCDNAIDVKASSANASNDMIVIYNELYRHASACAGASGLKSKASTTLRLYGRYSTCFYFSIKDTVARCRPGYSRRCILSGTHTDHTNHQATCHRFEYAISLEQLTLRCHWIVSRSGELGRPSMLYPESQSGRQARTRNQRPLRNEN